MKVLLCGAPGIPVLGPSGSSAHLRGIAGALQPDLVVAARRSDARGEHGAIDAPIVEVGVPGWPSWLEKWRDQREVWSGRRAARVLTRAAPKLIWERHALFCDAGWKAHAATGAKWVLEVNAPQCEERVRYETLRRPDWARGWERDVLTAAPCIVAVSRWLTDWCRSLGYKDVRHVPNGVIPGVGDRDGTRRRLGLEGKFVIGFLGSFKPWHGVDRLAAILDAIPDAAGLWVGEGPLAVEHARAVRVGQVREEAVADLVAAMDVGLAPYAADAPPWFCPLKVLAYRAQGTPVVATDIGDCRELVGEGGTVGGDPVDAILAWRGKRCAPWVRGWDKVVEEGLG